LRAAFDPDQILATQFAGVGEFAQALQWNGAELLFTFRVKPRIVSHNSSPTK
jgi:hypothetical protein